MRVERDGAVMTVVMSRPETRNAVDGATARALADAFRAFDADEGASVAVLWGEGGTFCSGADLTSITTGHGPRVDPPPADGPLGCTRMRLTKPVIAAVAGHAVAGGLELALWCDLRIAEEDATFGVYCRRWGVPLVDGGTFRLPRLIGTSRAMDLILTGRPVSAREAFDIGLANRLVPPGTSRAAAEQLAAELAGHPQTCLRGDRLSVLDTEGLPEDEAIAAEHHHGLGSLDDAARGAAEFAKTRRRAGTPRAGE
ncbi:crotonase/enoyl-CoA hydratase family protein [Actinomadura sp. 9N215]|uniref:crotonase/enoyl-CoA hydratase family protein n=1 Tax=Actinomadura sp. 9N215 TaxID=3375150 RepID=UPI00379C7C5F